MPFFEKFWILKLCQNCYLIHSLVISVISFHVKTLIEHKQQLKLPCRKEEEGWNLYPFFKVLSVLRKLMYSLKGIRLFLLCVIWHSRSLWKRNRDGVGLCHIMIATSDATGKKSAVRTQYLWGNHMSYFCWLTSWCGLRVFRLALTSWTIFL